MVTDRRMQSFMDISLMYIDNDNCMLQIILPTGTAVKIFPGGYDMFGIDITPSPNDEKQTEGLCGNFDYHGDNDLVYRGREPTITGCHFDINFVESWR